MRSFAIGLASLALLACGASGADDSTADQNAVTTKSDGLQLCAAVRGNGESILTHFASLSQIVEHYGVIDGMAGGSSGSITTFTYESILKNRGMKSDPARIALALKSVQGYADVVGDSDEATAIKGLYTTAMSLKASYDAKGIASLASSDSVEAAKRLKEVLSIPEVRSIVNPEALAMLEDAAHLEFNVAELETSIGQLGAFAVDDNRLFFRSGVLNWAELATMFGRVGDFYAGYGPSDERGMSTWLDNCADATKGLAWEDAAKVAIPSGGTCGSAYSDLLTSFRTKARAQEGHYASRIDERVGDASSPLKKLISTAVLEGDAVAGYESARARYLKGEFPTGQIPFTPSFTNINFGYWGNEADIAKVKSNPKHFDDLKTKKMSSLGNATWREILSASPAEPGLSRFVKLADGRYSGGGWSDLAPVLVLQNLGCAQTVYVTREGDESGFAMKIAKNLGMSESDFGNLYDLSSSKSGYARSVAAADAVWCTNWNGFTDAQMSAEVLDAFSAPFETHASFKREALTPYANTTKSTGKPGCTPGASAGATYPQ